MIAESLSFLQHSTVLVSLALLAVIALRGPWLHGFGAKNVMLLWLSVPVTMLALFLPAPVRLVEGNTLSTFSSASATPMPAMPGVASDPGVDIDVTGLLFALWLVGAVLTAAVLILQQWRFRRSLGRLELLPDGSFRSQFTDVTPALVGALNPRIVVPANFEHRYSPEQQSLILAHERCHLKRGDAQLTLLACLMRCLFWFNPLVHLAWSRFRIDQELACDASVLRNHLRFRREYAEAMLSTQCAAPQLPVGCTWLTGDPLRRRITMLYTRPPGKIQVLAGTVLALTATTAVAVGAWSSQEPQLRYQSAGTPQLELAAAVAAPVAPASNLTEHATRITAPSPASVAAPHAANVQARLAPPAPSAESAPSPTATTPSPGSAPRPAGTGASAPEAAPQSTPDATATVEVEHARLVETSRPSFPSTFNKPKLVSYPGMPESEQPGPDWQPGGWIWKMQVRVALDENGEPVNARIADNNLSSGGMVRRYERLALRAVKNWRYEPARIDGESVPSEVVLAFYFDTNIARPAQDDLQHPYGNKTAVFPQSVARSFVRIGGVYYSR